MPTNLLNNAVSVNVRNHISIVMYADVLKLEPATHNPNLWFVKFKP